MVGRPMALIDNKRWREDEQFKTDLRNALNVFAEDCLAVGSTDSEEWLDRFIWLFELYYIKFVLDALQELEDEQ